MKFNKNYRKSNNALPGNHVTNNVYNGKNSRVSLMHYLDSVPPMTQRDNVPDEQPETKEEEEDLPNIFNEAVEDSPSDSSTSKETDLDHYSAPQTARTKIKPNSYRDNIPESLRKPNPTPQRTKSPKILQVRQTPTLCSPIKVATGLMTQQR
jgi:hypothetical protein